VLSAIGLVRVVVQTDLLDKQFDKGAKTVLICPDKFNISFRFEPTT
jgi:hypothetical protein